MNLELRVGGVITTLFFTTHLNGMSLKVKVTEEIIPNFESEERHFFSPSQFYFIKFVLSPFHPIYSTFCLLSPPTLSQPPLCYPTPPYTGPIPIFSLRGDLQILSGRRILVGVRIKHPCSAKYQNQKLVEKFRKFAKQKTQVYCLF